MRTFILQQLLAPTIRRVGSLLGGFFISVGMEADLATQIEASTIALALFSVDLVNSYLARRTRG